MLSGNWLCNKKRNNLLLKGIDDEIEELEKEDTNGDIDIINQFDNITIEKLVKDERDYQ